MLDPLYALDEAFSRLRNGRFHEDALKPRKAVCQSGHRRCTAEWILVEVRVYMATSKLWCCLHWKDLEGTSGFEQLTGHRRSDLLGPNLRNFDVKSACLGNQGVSDTSSLADPMLNHVAPMSPAPSKKPVAC